MKPASGRNPLNVWIEMITIYAFVGCLFAVLVINIWGTFVVPERVEAYSVSETRRLVTECLKSGSPEIETIYNAPVGQPRYPIRWIVTCNEGEK